MHHLMKCTIPLLFAISFVWILPPTSGTLCPDKREKCPSDNTCCKLQTGEFGCCPFPHATCCSDKVHCCPSRYTCNLKQQTCTPHGGSSTSYQWFVPLAMNLSLQEDEERENSIFNDDYNLLEEEPKASEHSEPFEVSDPGGKCLDGKPCPEQFTCCSKVKPKEYGCCPYKEAVCCTDKIHCCPKGSICNTTEGTCNTIETPFVTVRAYSLETSALSVISLDSPKEEKLCSNGNKCKSGDACCGSGCCPLDKIGDCCDDMDYCCPKGTVCSPFKKCRSVSNPNEASEGTPVQRSISDIADNLKWFYRAVLRVQRRVPCPDRSSCPSGNTCCLFHSDTEYGCCPYERGTCCPDKLTCCPNGYTCLADSCARATKDGKIELVPRNKTVKSSYYF